MVDESMSNTINKQKKSYLVFYLQMNIMFINFRRLVNMLYVKSISYSFQFKIIIIFFTRMLIDLAK